MKLGLCTGCKRHIRVDELACPFCGETTQTLITRPTVGRRSRGSRAAYLMLSASTFVGVAACEGSDQTSKDPPPTSMQPPGSPGPGPSENAALPVYGAPDQGPPPMPGQPVAGSGEPMAVPVYGTPVDPQPADAGVGHPADSDAGVAVIPIYGLSVTPADAGTEDSE